MGADGTEAAVEAMAGGSHGFPVELSLSLSLYFFIFFGQAHTIVTHFVFLLDRESIT
jgi:hypothetical protein